ncbi:MAG TPA: hypothetical protein GX519_07395, partial [Thermoanaerobacterales bacterium]|nr:hypothetical protein [Thermoanaerobacterales bacterium]
MKRARKVFSVFLCLALMLAQLVSAAYALGGDSIPAETGIIEESGGGEKSTSGGIEESSEVEPGEIKETDGTEGSDDGDKSHVEPGEAGDGDGPGEGGELEEEPSDSGEPGQTSEPVIPEEPDEVEIPITTFKDDFTVMQNVYTYVYTDHINWYLNDKNATEYQIDSARELFGLAELVNGTAKDDEDKPIKAVDFSGKRITLTDDIDLSEVCHQAMVGSGTDPGVEKVSWQPIGTIDTQFKGVFDGGGHAISGLYINSDKTHLGLFGYISDAKIRDLTVEGSVKYVGTAWNSYVSGIAAYVAGTCELEGLTSSVALDNPSNNTGGIAAYMSGTSKISRCINHGEIHSGDSYAGGILGRGNNSQAVISNCYVTADIKGKYSTGAIVGSFNTSATLRDCFYYNPGGGMTIANSGSPENCYYLSDTPVEGAKGVAKDADAFKYGEVAYLLNGRSAHRSNWVQGKDYPIFGDESTEPLYRISIAPHIRDSDIKFEFIDLGESLHPILEENGGKSLYVPKGTRISIKFSKGTPYFMPEGICIPDESQVGVYYIEVSEEDAVVTFGTEAELTQPTLSWYSKDEVTFFINFEPELRGLELLVNSDDPELKDNFIGKTVILGRNIELHGDWKPIGTGSDKPFKGTFDGNGHSISGLKIGSSAKDGAVEGDYQGFFGYTQGT